jgi:hypothetical protein
MIRQRQCHEKTQKGLARPVRSGDRQALTNGRDKFVTTTNRGHSLNLLRTRFGGNGTIAADVRLSAMELWEAAPRAHKNLL